MSLGDDDLKEERASRNRTVNSHNGRQAIVLRFSCDEFQELNQQRAQQGWAGTEGYLGVLCLIDIAHGHMCLDS